MTRTSRTHPLAVGFVGDLPRSAGLPATARLGMTFAPGKKQPNAQSGAWHRDLKVDLERLRDHFGVDLLVSLTERAEQEQLGIGDLPAVARAAGLEHLWFPIPDVTIPRDVQAFRQLIEQIA